MNPGDIFDSAGTASVFSICVDRFAPDVQNRVVLASHGVIPGTYYALSFINGGGLNLRWFRDHFGQEEKRAAEVAGHDVYQVFDRAAGAIPPGAGGALFIPHLQGRVLPPDASLRGLWAGFTWAHSRGHLFRAILEAVAYEYAYYLEINRRLHSDLEYREVRAIGGGASSPLWNQIKSDVLNIPYCRINRAEVGTWGCAIIAGAAVGAFADMRETAKNSTRTTEHIRPRPAYHRHYRAYVALYSRLLGQFVDIFRGLSRLPLDVEAGVD